MSVAITIFLVLFVLTAVILDLKGILKLGGSVGLFLGFSVVPHEIMIFGVLFYKLEAYGIHVGFIIAWICITILFTAYWFTRLHIKPYCGKLPVKFRHSVLYGGGRILKYCAVSCVMQILFYIAAFINNFWGVWSALVIADSVFALIAIFLYIVNGTLRIMFLCYRLNIVKRVLYLLFLPIPIVNIFILASMAHLAQVEYDYAVYKMECETQRAESQVCKTKYPFLLVHGIGFRDFKYFNYWGRIPKALIKNGATVYYGNQEALGTVKDNAEDIKKRIEEVIKETGCEKVNIIAHSKGGLDARYTASVLGMGNYIASITTVSTPHRGSQIADEANKLPDSFYRMVANFMDERFKKLGDKNPDFYTACHQFTSEYAEQFNKEVPDCEGIYYQSYMSVMKNASSFAILSLTYLILKKYGRNDGLVTEESAKWGEFRGTFENKHRRGISHGDMIDLKREDYKGFDPVETYIQIVSDLKSKGF